MQIKFKTMPRTAKKPTRKKLVQKLDTVFSRYVRMSNADHRGFCECVTCKKKFHWKNIQAGHFMSRKHYSTRWDEQNVFPQCVGCNVYKNGEQYKYSLFLGSDLSEEMHRKSNQIVKYSSLELDVLINKYTELVKELEKKYI